jgi:YesN/AraC family two-component response regulator
VKPRVEDMIAVVLADDLEDFRALIRYNLEFDGRFQVVGEATNGEEAIVLTAGEHPHAIVLDIMMPRLDGISAIPKIRTYSPETKILILSAYNGHLRKEALSEGADDYLPKNDVWLENLVPTLISLCEIEKPPVTT